MAKLTVIDGRDLGTEYDLEESGGESAVVGRDPRADVPLQDSAVSREHCRIERTLRGFRVVDLRSRNRTFVNGEPIEIWNLRDGDVLRIGDTELRFEDPGADVDPSGVQSTIVKSVAIGSGRERILDDIAVPRTGGPSIPAAGSAVAEASAKAVRVRTRDDGGRAQEVVEFSRRLADAASPAELLEHFLAAVVRAMETDHAAFLTRADDRWLVRSTAGGGSRSVRASLSIVERAASERAAILSEDAAEDSRFEPKKSILRQGIGSALAVPVICHDAVLGVIYADRRGGAEAFGESDLELLRELTDPLGPMLDRLEEQGRLADENRNLLRSLAGARRIIGRSKGVLDVLDFIQRAAPTGMTVLIEGETGTGKELVASAIHFTSSRKGRPFIAINCAALPENLVESELFGHERGAFTGAVARKKGRFELGHTGTVLLDEVGDLSLTCQAKLLRLLEERSFERVGGTEAISVDVRIIAATNTDLLRSVAEGKFREDLYYRLGVLNVKLPPLRERPEDIPLLADHFLENISAGGRPRKLSAAAAKKLERYAWPGNVRQLRNVIESATVLGRGNEIQPDDLVLPEKARGSPAGEWEPITLEELEKRHVLRVLEHTRGNKKRAAEILGIERCTLYSKLKNYGV